MTDNAVPEKLVRRLQPKESCSVNNPNVEPLLLDIVHAAEVVGVGTGVIRGWTADGLPYIRAGRGGRKMFRRADLASWIARMMETATQNEIGGSR